MEKDKEKEEIPSVIRGGTVSELMVNKVAYAILSNPKILCVLASQAYLVTIFIIFVFKWSNETMRANIMHKYITEGAGR